MDEFQLQELLFNICIKINDHILAKEENDDLRFIDHYMISFYQNYSGQTLSSHLGWSHYCELLSISDKDKRSFYEKECSKINIYLLSEGIDL